MVSESGVVVYRTREDTSQDYHVEGCRRKCGGSSYAYVRRTANTADGDADLRRQHVANRVRIGSLRAALDAAGRRRARAGELAGRRPESANELRQPRRTRSWAGRSDRWWRPVRTRSVLRWARWNADARQVQDHGWHAHDRATFLATNFAPLLALDKPFMRSTVQTGPTPGYTFFPHVGTIRIDRSFNATRQGLTDRAQNLHLHP